MYRGRGSAWREAVKEQISVRVPVKSRQGFDVAKYTSDLLMRNWKVEPDKDSAT